MNEKHPAPAPPPLTTEAAGKRYAEMAKFRYFGLSRQRTSRATLLERSTTGAKRRGRASRGTLRTSSIGSRRRFASRPAYSRRRQWRHCCTACMTWSPRRDHYRLLQTTSHRLLLRVNGYRRKRGAHRQLTYAQARKRVGCRGVEVTVRHRPLLFAGAVARQRDGAIPEAADVRRVRRRGGSGQGKPGAALADMPGAQNY